MVMKELEESHKKMINLSECYEKEVYTRDEIVSCSDVFCIDGCFAFARAGYLVVEFNVLLNGKLEVESSYEQVT